MATIPYADVIDRQLLPVDSQEIVTRVRLVIAGDMAGSPPEHLTTRLGVSRDWVARDYAPEPITYVFEAPEHATYGVEKSFALPSGVNPFLPPSDPLILEPGTQNFLNPGAPSAMRDGDPLTFAQRADLGDGGSNRGMALFTYNNNPLEPVPRRRIWGYRLRYHLSVGSFVVRVHNRAFLTSVRHELWAMSAPPVTLEDDTPEDRYLVLPQDAGFNPVNNEEPVGVEDGYVQVETSEDADLRLVDFYPLILDELLLEDIARAQVRLPAQTPQRVTVRGYVPPDREHTITGWPGGDYTGAVAQHQYELGRTIIDFEQAGSPAGLPAEAIEAARERRQAIEGAVQVANYNLKMGSRR